MHTEDDLRATFSALEHQAPDPAKTLAGVDRLRTRRTARRRVTVMATVAVVTLALAAGSLAAPKLFHGGTPVNQPGSQARTPLEFRFAVDDIPGFSTYFQAVEPKRYDLARVIPAGDRDHSFDLYVFTAGVYDP